MFSNNRVFDASAYARLKSRQKISAPRSSNTTAAVGGPSSSSSAGAPLPREPLANASPIRSSETNAPSLTSPRSPLSAAGTAPPGSRRSRQPSGAPLTPRPSAAPPSSQHSPRDPSPRVAQDVDTTPRQSKRPAPAGGIGTDVPNVTDDRRSRKRWRANTGKSRAGPTSNGEAVCYFCKGAPQKKCRDCEMHLCTKCAINARVLVPGHHFDTVADSGTTVRTCADIEEAVRGGGDAHEDRITHGIRDTHTDDELGRDASSARTGGGEPAADRTSHRRRVDMPPSRPPRLQCYLCEKDLCDTRYECQDCKRILINFCAACRHVHNSSHTLRKIDCARASSPVDGADDSIPAGDEYPEDQFSEPDNDMLGRGSGAEDLGLSEVGVDGWPGGQQPAQDIDSLGRASDAEDSGLDEVEGDSQDAFARKRPLRLLSDPSERTSRYSGSTRSIVRRSPRAAAATGPRGSSTGVTIRRPDPSKVVVTFTAERFLQFTELTKNMMEVAAEMRSEQLPGVRNQWGHRQQEHSEPDDEDNDDGELDEPYDFRDHYGRRSDESPPSRRPWRPEERRLLRQMKERGCTDKQAAARLNRSTGAVTQQWRKQREI